MILGHLEKIKSKEFNNLELQFSNLIANYCLDFIKDCGATFICLVFSWIYIISFNERQNIISGWKC